TDRQRLSRCENPKLQIPKKIRDPRGGELGRRDLTQRRGEPALFPIGIWDLGFLWDLVLGIWCFSVGSMKRTDGRAPDQIRPFSFELGIAPNATGSVLVEMGNTRVICGV